MIDCQLTNNRMNIAKKHIYNICKNGQEIKLIKSGTKDEFGEIITESELNLKSHPVKFVPFDRKTAQSVSWIEDVDIICYIAMRQIENLDLNVKKLKRYEKLRFDNRDYEIKYIENYSGFGPDFLYIIIGGKI